MIRHNMALNNIIKHYTELINVDHCRLQVTQLLKLWNGWAVLAIQKITLLKNTTEIVK